ncbi:MAG: DUF1211 domain-containing protein [Xanthomonadales bacterium]|nr:DUF1211 domain-containing protein [Xanthomonadales bacterium]
MPTPTIQRDPAGFRLRGLDMTRIETFTDAAFAFALTLLVIALDPPTTMQALTDALVHVPGFVLSATMLMVFWNAHHRWSRRYGLDDTATILLSCLLVFTVLIFVYPLRFMMNALVSASAAMMGLSFGPDIVSMGIVGMQDANHMFLIYGAGFMTMSVAIALLNLHAWRQREALQLDATERVETRLELGTWCILFIAGLLSTLTAALLPSIVPVAAWPYAVLGIVVPIYQKYVRRQPPPDSDSPSAPATD